MWRAQRRQAEPERHASVDDVPMDTVVCDDGPDISCAAGPPEPCTPGGDSQMDISEDENDEDDSQISPVH